VAKFAILCYHRIGTGGVPIFSELPLEVFEEQIRYVRKRYRVISLGQLTRELQDPVAGTQSVAITFDDGYRDLYSQAFPILRRYGVPATVYLPAECIESGEAPWYDRVFVAVQAYPGAELLLDLDAPRSFELSSRASRIAAASEIMLYLRTVPDARRRAVCAELEARVSMPEQELADRMLTWDQIREMQAGGISFGSHTMSHAVVSRLPEAEAKRELVESKLMLEKKLQEPVGDFAFPFGRPADCGRAAFPLLAEAGYRSAVTTIEGVNASGANPYSLRRTQIGENHHLATFAFKLNELFIRAGEQNTADIWASSSLDVQREASVRSSPFVSSR